MPSNVSAHTLKALRMQGITCGISGNLGRTWAEPLGLADNTLSYSNGGCNVLRDVLLKSLGGAMFIKLFRYGKPDFIQC
jgi:hypothetical protein